MLLQAENMVSLKIAQEGYQKQESILIEEKEELKKQIISEKLDYEEKLREITAVSYFILMNIITFQE